VSRGADYGAVFYVSTLCPHGDWTCPAQRSQGTGSKFTVTLKLWDASTGKCLLTALSLQDDQWATVDFVGNRISAATPEAWRFLGWRITDPRTSRLRILPAEYYGPLPTGAEMPQ
jgi:hypothetical protein